MLAPLFIGNKIVASGTITAGSLKADLTTANAFAEFGVDISAYQDGRHKLRFTQGAYAYEGYISATAPGGETLSGLELVLDGDCETADPSINGQTWASSNNCLPMSLSDVQKHAGTKSNLMVGDVSIGYMTNTIDDGSECGLVPGALYKSSTWVYLPSGQGITTGYFGYRPTDTDVYLGSTSTTDSWVNLSGYFIDNDVMRVMVVRADAADVNGVSVYWDDFSLQRVTDCAATGALILSTIGGSRGWTVSNASFSGNSECTYTIYKVR